MNAAEPYAVARPGIACGSVAVGDHLATAANRAAAAPAQGRGGVRAMLAVAAMACALPLGTFGAASPAAAAQASSTLVVASPSPGRMDQPATVSVAVGLGFDTSAPASAKLAVGNSHACAVTAAGGVMCWGDNDLGQLGDGTYVDRWLPVPVKTAGGAPLTAVVAVSAGAYHSCALLKSGTAVCWGANGSGQLGAGMSSNDETSPVAVSGLSGAVAIAAGNSHACAVTAAGGVMCWGWNATGQVGTGAATAEEPTPVDVGGLAGVVAVSAGYGHTCALLGSGTVQCWGGNDDGQAGIGMAGGNVLTPQTVVGVGGSGVLANVSSVVAGYQHTCATLSSGAMRCWGANDYFQVGNGDMSGSDVPAPSAVKADGADLAGAVSAAAGDYHGCAIVTGGAVRCWGYNEYGQLGAGSFLEEASAARVEGLPGPALALAAGEYQTCALLRGGLVRCWGSNEQGRLGNGESEVQLTPTVVRLPGGTPLMADAVSAGRYHTCALSGGTARCWGANLDGQLGNGEAGEDLAEPVAVKAGTGSAAGLSGVASLTSGGYYTCALMQAATAKCWGYNYSGQLGDQTVQSRSAPVDVVGLAPASGIAAGDSHTCAIIAGGDKVACWGNNGDGQFGDGTKTSSGSLVVVDTSGTAVSQLALGRYHSCALRVDGSVLCWGRNSDGQLGRLINGDLTKPAAVFAFDVGGSVAVAVAAGGYHSCALVADATVRCWGNNGSGQLGNGTFDTKYTPVQVMLDSTTPLTNVTAITAGSSHTCAIASGKAYCWGRGYSGQLGNGTFASSNYPVPVLGPNGGQLVASAISAGNDHTCALTPAGVTTCWGYRYSGQVGDGVLGYSTRPVGVGPAASGAVTLRDGGKVIATLKPVDGVATFKKKLPAGLHALKASFAGDAALGPSSASLDHLVTGTPGRDRIKGGKAGDVFYGLAGNDRIRGGGGNDRIDGGGGRDVIEGGAGKDRLTGGKGRDTFVYRKASDSTKRRPDVITDFRKGDRIDLSRFDGSPRRKGRQRFTTWRGGKAFTGRPGELRFISRKHRLEGDTNGDRRPDFSIVLKGVKTLKRKALKLD